MMKYVKTNRRKFLKEVIGAAVGTMSFPYIVPSPALGKAGNVEPSSRITMGFIGVGGMGTNNMRAFLSQPDVQVVGPNPAGEKTAMHIMIFATYLREMILMPFA